MPPVARVDDHTVCPVLIPLPHVTGSLENRQPVHMEADGKPVIRLADFADCLFPPRDVVIEASATVTLCGLPVARRLDKMIHGGLIIEGSPTVLIGGPSFSLPSTVRLEGSPEFQSTAARDLYLLSTTRTGQEMFSRLDASGQPVTIKEWSGTNGYCSPVNDSDATSGKPTGSTILWNPDYRSNAYDKDGNLLAQPPQVILLHEMAHALANSEGRHRTGTDPSPPDSEKTIEEEEAQAIGTGSHSGDFPTENSLREDLHLGRRDNHFGTGGPDPNEPKPLDLRVGNC